MHPAIRKTDVGAQKIDGSTLETFGMAIAGFLFQDKLGKVVLGMPFLTLSSADIRFAERELVWRTYMAAEALPTAKRVEPFNAKEFAAAALGVDDEAFVVHVVSLLGSVLDAKNVHLSRQAQIASLDVKEVTIPVEYSVTPTSSLRTPRRSYPSTPASTTILSTW